MLTTPILGSAQRLEALELANRRLRSECKRWRWVGGVLLTGLGILSLAGAARTWPTLEAKELVLRDTDGVSRAVLSVRPDGTPGLGFFDKQGQVRLSLDLGLNDAPGVNLYGQDGVLRSALALRPDGTPGFALFDRQRRPRLSLDLGIDESTGLNVYGEGGILRAALAIRPDGTPGLGLFDRQGQILQSFDLDAIDEAARPEPPR